MPPKKSPPLPHRNICGPQIRKRREVLKMTQLQLSELISKNSDLSLSRSTIAKIEVSIRCVTDYELVAISKALDVSLSTLLPK